MSNILAYCAVVGFCGNIEKLLRGVLKSFFGVWGDLGALKWLNGLHRARRGLIWEIRV